MINAEKLLFTLKKKKINFFSGVPDSVLSPFINLLRLNKEKNIICANEGGAIALGLGYYLSTKKIPLVYFQNSGLSNAINPLVSVAHEKIYSLPLLLLIGWRGAPGIKDEPQHIVKGKITKKLLKLLKIKNIVINNEGDFKKVEELINYIKKKNKIGAILVKNNKIYCQKKYLKLNQSNNSLIKRRDAIKILLERISRKDKLISTTGYTSRELFQTRKQHNLKKGKDFYLAGGMGHASMVSLGVSLNNKNNVICLDGDGSLLMQLGSLISTGFKSSNNFKHILFNNGSHESVGNHLIDSQKVNLKYVVKSFGYRNYFICKNKKKFQGILDKFLKSSGPSFFEITIQQGTFEKLIRPANFKKILSNFLI
jgi:phosphonopyruvate decarboxylase